jgi:2-amino-4-hydroxy-6-hydroxymethyldihydropteridine diphosphokinase
MANLKRGLSLLSEHGVKIQKVSSVYETRPVGETSDPRDYLNLGVLAETGLEPLELLECLKSIERDLGRESAERWMPRTLDIDLILYGGLVMETPVLTLPHPLMRERAFVLLPLFELEPDFVLPDGTPVRGLIVQSALQSQEVRLFHANLSIPSH